MSLDKVMMPVPDGHPDVFDREWPLRVADIDREGRLRFDAAARHIVDIGQDQLREMGFEETHPLWIVRRTMIDLIRPIEFGDMLRMRRWCSGTSNRWCDMRVRIDGRKGGLLESEAFWINFNRDTQTPARISDDFLDGLRKTTDVDRLRWRAYLKAGSREDAAEIHEFPVRFTDIDFFDHMNNSVYWSVVEDYLASYPELLKAPLRVTIEHDAAVALSDKLEIISHVYPPGATDRFGENLADRTVRTLTYAVGDETKALAAIFPL
ncbi:acyl-ACP thioesterase domain-containing protein [Mycobacterium sp.]|uniref:acyl-ACP thioesterase domain-containing protein n=1 Tax=Mycobacterium sp. TaxID=1785 RepID=UPI003BB08FAD